MMKHTPGPWWAHTDGCNEVWSPDVMVTIADERDCPLIALAPTAPHECDPECPGDQNRRKLEAFDELLAVAKRASDDMDCQTETAYEAWLALDATIAHAEAACTKT